MEKITIGFMHFFVYYVVREMGGEKWKKLTFFHKGKIQTYNNITKYAKFSNVFCGRTERGKIHEKAQDLSFWEKPCAFVSYVIFSL